MKPDLLDILRCPVCKGPLTLAVDRQTEREIETGTLACRRCSVAYPIVDGIPDLLPPEDRA